MFIRPSTKSFFPLSSRIRTATVPKKVIGSSKINLRSIIRIDRHQAPYINDALTTWDFYLAENRAGEVLHLPGGEKLLMFLGVRKPGPNEVMTMEERDATAQPYYALVKSDGSIEYKGAILPPGLAKGGRQWAVGGFLKSIEKRTDNEMRCSYLLGYTAVGEPGEKVLTFGQKIVLLEGDLVYEKGELHFDWKDEHKVLIPPSIYDTHDSKHPYTQLATANRDPYFVLDDRGTLHVYFSASQWGLDFYGYNACIGHAYCDDLKKGDWRFTKPLIASKAFAHNPFAGQFAEKEVAEVKHLGGNTYLVTFNARGATVRQEWQGQSKNRPQTALYGFISRHGINGPYDEPVNENGVIMACPEDFPNQLYAWRIRREGQRYFATCHLAYPESQTYNDYMLPPFGTPVCEPPEFAGGLGPIIELEVNAGRGIVLPKQNRF